MKYSPSLSLRDYTNNKTYKRQVFDNVFSCRENNESNELIKNYFSKNENLTKNENKRNKIPKYPNTLGNANTIKIKIKKISEMKCNQYKRNLINKNKYMNSNPNILENKKDKKNINKNNIYQTFNSINRSNSNNFIKNISYKSLFNKNKYESFNFERFNPTIIGKKTSILYPKLNELKMNFNMDELNLIQNNRNNTPSFMRYAHSREYFGKYINKNEFYHIKI